MNKPSKRAVMFVSVSLVVILVVFSVSLLSRRGRAGWKLPTGTGTPALAIGANHGVILASDGSLWAWGESGFGRQVLGLGSNVRTQALPRRIGVETNWVNIAVGGSTTLALKSDGKIWAWGENVHGQLGDGTKVSERASPVLSILGQDWKQVATAGPHSVALKRDGTLWSWGNNWAGQLGDGTTNQSGLLVRIGSSTNWTRVWANLLQNVGQQTDGSLWFWGWDYTRSSAGSSISVPTRVSLDTNWVDVGMGDWMVFAIKSDGTLWAWGRNAHLYTGASPDADSWPVPVGRDNNWKACASFAQSCPVFMKRDGSLWVMDLSAHRGAAVVTGIVTGLVTNNQLNIVADSTTLGGDPEFGIFKTLEISFTLGSTTQVLAFAENSAVSLGAGGQTLTITQALYGDPVLIRSRAGPWLTNSQPAHLRTIRLPNKVVAFCGGRHMTGAALMADGEVWTWGEAMGQHTPAIPPLQFCSRLLGRVGIQVHWGEPGPVIFKEPARLSRSAEEQPGGISQH